MSIFHNNILGGAAGQGGDFIIERSLRFTRNHSSYLSRTFGAGNNRKFTVSAWIKRTPSNTSEMPILGCYDDYSNQDWFGFQNDELVAHHKVNGTTRSAKVTDRKFRDFSAWYHIVYAFNSTLSNQNDRTKFYVNGERQTVSTYNGAIGSNENVTMNKNNLVHYIGVDYLPNPPAGHADCYMAEMHFVDDQELDADDFGEYDNNNVWQPKKYSGTYGTTGFYLDFADNSSTTALGYDAAGSNNWTPYNFSAKGGDPSYVTDSVLTGTIYSGAGGVEKIFDGTTATCGPNVNSYVTFTPSTAIPINSSLRIRANVSNGSHDAVFAINGNNVSTVSTGFPVSGGIVNSASTWTTISNPPSSLTSLKFGWGNHWMSVSGIEIDGQELLSSTKTGDSVIDTPTDNYAIMNVLTKAGATTIEDGGLHVTHYYGAQATIGMPEGKYYFEFEIGVRNDEHTRVGINKIDAPFNVDTNRVEINTYGQVKIAGVTQTTISALSTGDVVGVAFNADTRACSFYVNGSLGATVTAPANDGVYAPACGFGAGSVDVYFNAGQQGFQQTEPTGFDKRVRTADLPDPTFKDPSTVFDVVTYTGDGNSTKTISGLSFTPDIIWHKRRNFSHYPRIFDSARGVSNSLFPSENYKQNHVTDYGYVTGTSSTGFTVGQGNHSQNLINVNNGTYVNWCWGTGSSSSTTITAGSINSTVRRNQNAGFSIVTWTGNNQNATIGHGLNAVPELIILKDVDTNRDWYVGSSYISGSPWLKFMKLNSPDSANSNSDIFQQGGQPSSSVFGVGQVGNASGSNIAYCFTSVEHFSKIGTYKGTGTQNDGPFVYCGFAPRFLIAKNMQASSGWWIWDTERREHNVNQKPLSGDTENSEENDQEYAIDFLSNGFKVRATNNANVNSTASDYLFMAFADDPFQVARAR